MRKKELERKIRNIREEIRRKPKGETHGIRGWANVVNIIAGIGVGDVRYGMLESEIVSRLGKPDLVDVQEVVEGAGDWYRELWYSSSNLSFTLNSDDDYRLGGITVRGPGHSLLGKHLFGEQIDAVSKLIAKETGEIARFEDHSSVELPDYKLLTHDGLGIMFWFEFGVLCEMQCGYLFASDDDTVMWPPDMRLIQDSD